MFLTSHGETCSDLEQVEVVERIVGDERAFHRDHQSATDEELGRTLQILEWARADLIQLLESATQEELDWDERERQMPSWATWRTLRAMAWHVVDTESRYYLPRLGVDSPPRASDLFVELDRSAAHVRRSLSSLPRALARESKRQTWTTTKLLRRLAWHERGEVDAMRALLSKARAALTEQADDQRA